MSIIDLNHGVVQELDVGRFNEKYFIYVASFGLFAESSYATPRNLKQRFGHLAYVITGTKELVNLKSYHVKLSDDKGNTYEDDYVYGSVSNSTSIGGLMRFDEELVNLQDGLHEVVLIRKRLTGRLTASTSGQISLLRLKTFTAPFGWFFRNPLTLVTKNRKVIDNSKKYTII